MAAGETPSRTHAVVELHGLLSAAWRLGTAPVESLARWSDCAVAPRDPGFGAERAEVDLAAMVAGVGAVTAEARTLVEQPPG